MDQFKKILFVSYGVYEETEGLKQALSMARNNQAALSFLIVAPRLPGKLGAYKDKYLEFLQDQLRDAIRKASQALGMEASSADIPVAIECGEAPAIRIVRHVLNSGHDLVIKEAEPAHAGDSGFRALDMELLRKCPCPVWLSRPIARSRNDIKVAVAIDPESEEKAGRDLAIRLLQLARIIADSCSGRLDVVSCWSFEYEEFLRHSPFAKLPEERIREEVTLVETGHLQALKALIDESGINGAIDIRHLRGEPEERIPAFVREQEVDILVMGTIARTGLRGFSMGNTAENILRRLRCSLLALKPEGFVSSVKP